MGFFSDIFNRAGRVARGQANAGVDAMEDATFEATVRQTVADMKTELNNVVRASAMAMSNYNSLQAEYDKELGAGLLTRVLVGYEVGGVARFAGAWRKP